MTYFCEKLRLRDYGSNRTDLKNSEGMYDCLCPQWDGNGGQLRLTFDGDALRRPELLEPGERRLLLDGDDAC